ncbi:MAG: undecaprenyl/decaprenyl-phosphate alpha-N-acetylglucosaminyl 1-phosphate transferase [Gammaproteobacteria bacterium]|nr:undecaprenyl/decaprenyl-phosphate alpha-N-acetylglucosaminyl 1-phosphate transferase [Gammaproteobacteria bacterium]
MINYQHAILHFAAAFVLSLLLVPAAMVFARKIGAVEMGGYRKVNKKPIPLLGGLAIAVPYLIVLVLGRLQILSLHSFLSSQDLTVLLIGTSLILLLGIIDDSKEIRARYKLIGQLLATSVIFLSPNFIVTKISLPWFGLINLGFGLGAFLSFMWVLALINAFNLIDGLDGLASGVALIAILTMLGLDFFATNNINILFVVLAATILAFLFYNFNPAKVFLGDTGSMFLGYTMAILTLLFSHKSGVVVTIIAPLLALSFPILEMAISIFRRLLRGAPVFTSDGAHTHHKLLNLGYSQRKVVLLIYLVSAIFGISAILMQVLPEQMIFIAFILVVVNVSFLIWLAGYLSPHRFVGLVESRQNNILLNSLATYANTSLRRSINVNDFGAIKYVLKLCMREMYLNYLSVQLKNNEKTIFVYGGVSRGHSVEEIQTKLFGDETLIITYQLSAWLQNDDLAKRHTAACLVAIFS